MERLSRPPALSIIFSPLCWAFNAGMEGADHSRLLANLIRCLMAALIALFLVYIIVDVWLAIYSSGESFSHGPCAFQS